MALQDKIGRQPFVDKICGLVDSLQKDQNFCLSINGTWGSGKSFVLQMIEEQLSKKPEYIIVKYDAWENTFYSDPLIAILSCLIDGIEDKLYLVERSEEKAKKAVKKAANTLAKLSAKIKALKEIITGIKNVIKSFHNPIDTEAMGDFKSYQKLLRETKEVLNEITQKGEYEKKRTKLIVLVDEIDRCLPDEQLKILERLHHLFDIKNCAVIVAMNQTCIAKTVHTIYGVDGYEYLRKFFDFTYKLETSASEYLKSLLEDLIENFEKIEASRDLSFAVKAAYMCLFYGQNKLLDTVDNREITRYYEALQNICNDFGWEKLTPQYVFFIIIGLFIRKNVSSAFLIESDIVLNQEAVDAKGGQATISNVPYINYFDYIDKYVGIDGENFPQELYTYRNGVLSLVGYFNEIVYYSLGKQFSYNELRLTYGHPTVNPAKDQELRRLVILYGGEQERCDK